MKMIKHISLLLSILLFSSVLSLAQNIELETKLEKDSIIIGEQIEYIIKAKAPNSSQLLFPIQKDTISKNIEIISESEIKIQENNELTNYEKKYLITSFDTGYVEIGTIPLQYIIDGDTSIVLTNTNQLLVRPYVLLDTIPRDTTFAKKSGHIIFGKDGFKNQIDQLIPDSIKKTIPKDSLQTIRAEVEQVLRRMFLMEISKAVGITDENEITEIFESQSQKMFILEKTGIQEKFTIPGSVDSVFVNELDEVKSGDLLYTSYKIKDINEDITYLPYNWSEFWYNLKNFFAANWWIIILILVLAAVLTYYLLFRKNKDKISIFKVKPKAPAHEIALMKLKNIKNEKIWSKGLVKDFHVQITDVIREYLENRFGINALEMTTSEILLKIKETNCTNEENFNKIKQILELADSVKFAKYSALQNENDLSITNSVEFVEDTKEIEVIDNKTKRIDAEIEIINNEENSNNNLQ